MEKKPVYDCDTTGYRCSEEDYHNLTKKYGRFIDNGAAYEIYDRHTPRPWLNYLCNDRFCAVITNDGMGYTIYRSFGLLVTKYNGYRDYLPRTFDAGRRIILRDTASGKEWDVLREAEDLRCVHRPGYSVISARIDGMEMVFTVFVPLVDPGECWKVEWRNRDRSTRGFTVRFEQIWSFLNLYTLRYPDEKLTVTTGQNQVIACSNSKNLPFKLYGFFLSPNAIDCRTDKIAGVQPDGGNVVYTSCSLTANLEPEPEAGACFYVFAGAEEDESLVQRYLEKYQTPAVYEEELSAVKACWEEMLNYPTCRIPEVNLRNFLNVWLKNQMYLTFRYVRTERMGYRDTLQDCWGYTLLNPARVRPRLLQILSHMKKDGSCPRQYDLINQNHDMRDYADSASWIPLALTGYIKETGDFDLLKEKIPYLDDETPDTVEDHVWRGLESIYRNRGPNGICLIKEGDWNDSLEGIGKSGPATSVWLTMAVHHAQNLMAELYQKTGECQKSEILQSRAAELKKTINDLAWDGAWYIYAFSGAGQPIGSHRNEEGKIHLNTQTWAIFTGIADTEKTARIRESIAGYLETPFGPALLWPPYTERTGDVGRINRLEPGSFENGAVYQHAVTFMIYAHLVSGHYDEAADTFIRLLPTNPVNFDHRRASEPYCTGNFYYGPTHPQHGQNGFSWFSANVAWLLRAGFDEICGVKADYDGLLIEPKVPEHWDFYTVRRKFRGATYDFEFRRAFAAGDRGIWSDGVKIEGNKLMPAGGGNVKVTVRF